MDRRTWVYPGLVVAGLLLAGGLSGGQPGAHAAPAPAPADLAGVLPPSGACNGLNNVNSPNVGGNNYLAAAAAVASNDVWAVGYAANSTLTEHWNGSAWSIVPSPSPGSFGNYLLGVVASATNDVWAVGYSTGTNGASQTLVEHWDGSAWSVIPSPTAGVSSLLRAVTVVAADDIWAAGDYVQTSTYTLVEHWNGTVWSIVASPNPSGSGNYFYALAAVGANDVWAVGNYSGQGILQPLAEHWDGTSWSIITMPDGGTGYNYIRGLAAVAGNDVWAVGYAASASNQTLVEHWNGSAWSIVPSPNPGAYGSYLTAVTALASGNIWAVGYDVGPGYDRTLAAHWDGSAWSVVPSASIGPYQNQTFGVAAAGPADVWMVGQYINQSNTAQTLTNHYTGSCIVQTSTPATLTATPTPLPTICPSGVIQNGDFETGSFPPWVILGVNPVPTIVGGPVEPSHYYAQFGTVSGPEPLGDSSIYQTITVPAGSSTLSYWWMGGTTDTITYDWQDAYVTDTNGNILATIMHNCQTTGGWVNQTFNMTPYAGQTVRIEFLVHQDGFGDDTYMNLDDVTLLTPFCPSPTATATGTPPTSTPTVTRTVTRTSTPTPTPTYCAVPGVIQNGGFETGSLAPWIVDGFEYPPVVVMTTTHTGAYSLLVGSYWGQREPDGASSAYQQITVPPAGGTLSFWYWPSTYQSDFYDYQAAYITDLNGNILATLLYAEDEDQTWKQVTYNLVAFAGQTVRVKFLVQQDGFGDTTLMFVDDVTVLTPCSTPTVTPTGTPSTPTPSRTPTATSTVPTPTATPCLAPNPVQNPGFETGGLAPWVARDQSPPPTVRPAPAHSGSFAAFLGHDPGGEPAGDSAIDQQITVPAAGGTLSFWYDPYTEDNLTHDWQDAYITDLSGNILATVMHVCAGTQTWTRYTYNLVAFAGQTVRLKFLVHEDGYGDATNMYLDDVAVELPAACGTASATPTATPTVACPAVGWTTVAPYPIVIWGNAVAAQAGALYSFSGASEGNLLTQAAYKFDGTAWRPIAPFPASARQGAVAVSDGTYLYIIGGLDASQFSTSTIRYNPATDSYTTLAPYPAPAVGTFTAAYLNGKIYRIAGCNGLTYCISSLSRVDVYDIATNTWTAGPPYPSSQSGVMAASDGAFIYTAGGYGSPNLSVKAYRFDGVTWDDAAVADLPAGRDIGAAGILNGRWILAGGNVNYNPTNTAIALDLSNPAGGWTDLPPMPFAREYLPGGVLGSAFYAVGGYTGNFTGSLEAQRYLEAPCATPTVATSPSSTPVPPPTSSATPASTTSTPVRSPVATGTPPAPTATPASTTSPPVRSPVATGTPPAPTTTPLPPTAPPCTVQFADVHATDYFYTPVTALACRGVIAGYADGTFRPYIPATRAQVVKIVVLGFALPLQTPAGGAHTFADVPPDQPFFAVIETAAARGVLSGYNCGGPGEPCDAAHRPYFRPYADVTRGQLAKIVVVAAGWPLYNPPSPTFTDVAPGSAFYPFVETAACRGVISGYADHTFRPYTNATRGQIAKIVDAAVTGPPGCVP